MPSGVVENWEGDADPVGDVGGTAEVIDAYGEDLSVQSCDVIVVVGQLSQLPPAVCSPEGPVKHQHHILVVAIGCEGVVGTLGGGQLEAGG